MACGWAVTRYHTFKTRSGQLAQGCKRCVKGEKLVLFITGICGNGCTYCPVSDQKHLKDVIFANERKVKDVKEVIQEAMLMRATGAGITGGDPLAVMDRTCSYLRSLKRRFGDDFHIHLYTPLLRVTKKNLQRLRAAGLDEIRFHPKIDDDSSWSRLLWARGFGWSVGVEVPLIPGQEEGLRALLRFLADNALVDFVNLNEFEYADNQVFEKAGVRYEPKDALSYGVKGSVTMGKRLLSYGQGLGLAVHLCTARCKDAVQLARRIKRRSERSAKPFDAVDEEGLLTRGALYDWLSIADTGYLEKLSLLSREEKVASLRRLRSLRRMLMEEWAVPAELLFLDEERLRLLTTTSVAEAVAKQLNRTVALVKEYPTHDCFLVEADVLRRCSPDGDND